MAVEFDIKLTVKDMYRFTGCPRFMRECRAGFLCWRRRFCFGRRQTAMGR